MYGYRRALVTDASGGLLVMLATWLIPLGPALGGVYAGYVEGPERRQGIRAGAEAGLVGFGLVLVVSRRWTGGVLFEQVVGETSSTGLLWLLVGLFLYVVGLATVGGFVGARLSDTDGDTDGAQPRHRRDR